MARTIIHIGMPRTASTYLQQEYFPKIEGFIFYGVATTQYSDPFQRLLYQDDSLFDENLFEETAAQIRSQDAILSNELFVGQSLYLNSTNRSRTARRLKKFFPEAEIILLLRNQVTLLQSLYAIGIYSGHTCSPEEFIRFSDTDSTIQNALYPTFAEAENTESYKYSHLIELYKQSFSEVHILLYEDFKINPMAFAEKLSEMLKVQKVIINNPIKKVNKSLSDRQIKLLTRLNRYKPLLNRGRFGKWLFGYKLRFIEHYIPGKTSFKFSPELEKKLRFYYKDDNNKLGDLSPQLVNSKTFQSNYLESEAS